MSKTLNGRELRNKLIPELKSKIFNISSNPQLVIIQIGNLKESDLYIKIKKEFGRRIGVEIIHQQYSESVLEEEIISDIKRYNEDSNVFGIMVQLPIPKKLNKGNILNTIDPKKDIDCLTGTNINSIFNNKEFILPATTQGIITLLEENFISIKGKKVAIVGESTLVGRPTALAFLNRGATVTICHEHTVNLEEETKKADILIVAIGKPKYITAKYVSSRQVIVDVGINVGEDGKIVGDVDYENVKDLVKAITPVPGGIGPMTVFSLFNNIDTL